MPEIDLDLQLKFLTDLDRALDDAVRKYADQDPEKLDELYYMRQEVTRAREVIGQRQRKSERAGERSRQHDLDYQGEYQAVMP